MDVSYHNFCESYRAYGLNYSVNGTLYVLGNLNLPPIEYDPMGCMPEILMELLRIGNDSARGEDIGLRVQSFCCRYGLLGFEQALVQKTYDDCSVKFYADNILGRKAATAKEFESIFDPFPIECRRQRWRSPIERIPQLAPLESEELVVMELDYCECEAVSWYGQYGQQLYELLRKFQAGESLVLLPGNAEVRYELSGGKGCRRVYYDSLKSACDFYVMEMLTASIPAIRLCKHCGAPLLTRGTRAEYCSASCRNVTNVTNSRRRKRSESV